MRLHSIKNHIKARTTRKRVGRGIGSGFGKTCGLGHKGQKARAGGYHKIGFEGGQMPLQRRLPKMGFSSKIAKVTAEIRLDALKRIQGDLVNLQTLKEAGLINNAIKNVKIILAGNLERAYIVHNSIRVTKGARSVIEKQGGSIEETK